jgi:hypothetical protein
MVQEAFRKRGNESLQAFDATETKQRVLAAAVLTCYSGVLPQARPQAWTDAQTRGLLKPEQEEGEAAPAADQMLVQLNGLHAAGDKQAALASNLYATQISQPSGFSPDRETLLEQHRDAVCKLAAG